MFPWGGLTSGGVADNALHLQLKYSAVGKYAQFTQVFLMTGKPEKDEKLPIHSIDFGKCETRGGSQYYEYTEYILPVSYTHLVDKILRRDRRDFLARIIVPFHAFAQMECPDVYKRQFSYSPAMSIRRRGLPSIAP